MPVEMQTLTDQIETPFRVRYRFMPFQTFLDNQNYHLNKANGGKEDYPEAWTADPIPTCT